MSDDLRPRLTGSVYHRTGDGTRDYLYNGDRAGSRYTKILETEESANHFTPRFNPGFPYLTSFQVNPFAKYRGLEFFGVLELADCGTET